MQTTIPESNRPEYYDRLAELMDEGTLELIREDGICRMVYLMNDAVESFLVFEDAVVTGVCLSDVPGETQASLELYKDRYILCVMQGDQNAFTISFKKLLFEMSFYDYGETGHFWRAGDEDLRWIQYLLFVIRDKLLYLGNDAANDMEYELGILAAFEPLWLFSAVPPQYDGPYVATDQAKAHAAELMKQIAEDVGDFSFARSVERYLQKPTVQKVVRLADKLQKRKHFPLVYEIIKMLQQAGSQYPKRKFERIENPLVQKVKERKAELEQQGNTVFMLWQEPFVIGKQDVPFLVQLLVIDTSGFRKKSRVELYEISGETWEERL